MISIDYLKIAKAEKFYSKRNYKKIDAPWWVSEEISKLTKPEGMQEFSIKENNKVLVASGEQSFLYMANKGRLIDGQYLTTTPCFRADSIGRLHKKCFLKTELIKTDIVNSKELEKMISIAYKFFLKYFNKNQLQIIQTDKYAFDIELITNHDKLNNIELGSYGIRSCEFLEWIYGTGCAEPRLSRAIQMLEYIENDKNFRRFK